MNGPTSRPQLTALSKPFPSRFISPAPSGHGDYVAHDIITQRLLLICGAYDFHVTEIVRSPDGIVEGCLATLTVEVDGKRMSVTEAGECDNPTQKKTQGDRLKNAASDAIKRCAMRLGMALHLWAGADKYFLHEGLSKANPNADDELAKQLTAGEEPF